VSPVSVGPLMIRLTEHAARALHERGIRVAWIRRTVEEPERLEFAGDGTVHCIARVKEHDGRWLWVVARHEAGAVVVITAFFDRRVGRSRK